MKTSHAVSCMVGRRTAVTCDAVHKVQEERVSHPAIAPNHVAVVTGGASGIGLAAAMRFAGLGMKVCIADLGGDRLKEAEAKLSSVARGASADVMAMAVDVS